MKLIQYRQGDVLIERIDSVPSEAVKQKHKGRITVALGEATGHHHSINVDEPDDADWWKQGDDQFVTTEKEVALTHQEHATVTLPPGTYRITRQREYTPQAIRNVAD